MYKDDSKKGLVLELHMEYPKDLHDLQNTYPCAPKKLN